MKKILNILICLGLLLQNFAFSITVYASESKIDSISSINVKQGDNVLSLNEDVYNITEFNEDINVSFNVELSKDPESYAIFIYKNGSMNGMIPNVSEGEYSYSQIKLSSDTNRVDYKFSLCEREMHSCKTELDSITYSFTYDKTYALSQDNIFYTDIIQDGESVIPKVTDYGYKFILKPDKDITLKIKGVNLLDDVNYIIMKNTDMEVIPLIYKGSELENGVEISINVLEDQTISYVSGLKLFEFNTIKYQLDGNNYFFTYQYYDDSEVETFTSELIYTNHSDIIMNKYNDETNEDKEYYVIDNTYYNGEETLSLNLIGKYYSDKFYDMSIKVTYGEEIIYTKNDRVNGLDLMETEGGYKVELDGLDLKSLDDYNNLNKYNISVTIGDYTQEHDYKYSVGNKKYSIKETIFYGNGDKTINSHAGWGTVYGNGGVYTINKEALNKYSMYLHYLGDNFDVNKVYTYVLEYGNELDRSDRGIENSEKIYEGSISGSIFNTSGIAFNVSNEKNYVSPAYRLTIKDGDNIVYFNQSSFDVTTNPTITKIDLIANRTLYYQMDEYNYLATTNIPISVNVSGISFDNNLEYQVEIQQCDHGINEQLLGCITKTYKYSGSDVNEGLLKLTLDKLPIGAISRYVGIIIYDENKDTALTDDGIFINYVDSTSYFPTNMPYIVDNENDIIKNISKNTKVEDFNDVAIVKDGGKVNFYDKSGNKIASELIGTGMIAKVTDVYNRNLFDLEVVVKGDVTGDGNISITDLVKVNQHINSINNLTGLYELAGDVTNTGVIEKDDLEKISKDLAGIEEVK